MLLCNQKVANDYKDKDHTTTKNGCCLIWNLADCLLAEAKKQCPQGDQDEMIRNLKVNGDVNGYKEYPYGSSECSGVYYQLLSSLLFSSSMIFLYISSYNIQI